MVGAGVVAAATAAGEGVAAFLGHYRREVQGEAGGVARRACITLRLSLTRCVERCPQDSGRGHVQHARCTCALQQCGQSVECLQAAGVVLFVSKGVIWRR